MSTRSKKQMFLTTKLSSFKTNFRKPGIFYSIRRNTFKDHCYSLQPLLCKFYTNFLLHRQTLTQKVEEHSFLKSIDPKSTLIDPKSTPSEVHHPGTAEVNQERSSPPLSPSHMRQMEMELFEEPLQQDRRQWNAVAVDKHVVPTPAVVKHVKPPPAEEERSLTKEELKEKVELFREQVNIIVTKMGIFVLRHMKLK